MVFWSTKISDDDIIPYGSLAPALALTLALALALALALSLAVQAPFCHAGQHTNNSATELTVPTIEHTLCSTRYNQEYGTSATFAGKRAFHFLQCLSMAILYGKMSTEFLAWSQTLEPD
ncbi:hypothetical protein CLU79DRAFT_749533 [Phycomyces nitens]|nr:hypothetical protein CLU79DRAFT_749533 [Phycomyces nitens]